MLQVATEEVDENSYAYDIGEESGNYVVWKNWKYIVDKSLEYDIEQGCLVVL